MKRKFRVSYEIEIDPEERGCFKDKELSAYEQAVITTAVSADVSNWYMKGFPPKYLPGVTEIVEEPQGSYTCSKEDLLHELNMLEQTLDGMECPPWCKADGDGELCHRCNTMIELKELSEKIKNDTPLCSGD